MLRSLNGVCGTAEPTGYSTENSEEPKSAGQASPKAAFQVGTRFDLHVLARLGGLDKRLQAALDRTLETWLLLGTLGLRGTRAAGSFRWEPAKEAPLAYPTSFDAYVARCLKLLAGAPLKFAILDTTYSSAEEARKVVSDTLGGRDDHVGQNSLARLNDPLGKIGRGERKTSPLRFRVVSIGTQSRIAVVWDARERVTGNRPSDLAGIIKLLAERKPALGQQLEGCGILH